MSKPITVWSLLYYLTEIEGLTWRQIDWTTNRIVKATKGEPFKGYFQLKVGDKIYRFDQANIHKFMPALFGAIATQLSELVEGPFDLVPIPNSAATTSDGGADFRTWSHAREIAARMNGQATVVPALRWKVAKQPTHEGGSRDPQVLFENLQVVATPTQKVVLFDDVVTAGSHTIAACRRLAQVKAVPALGIVVGRSTKEQKPEPLTWNSEIIETEEVVIDWDSLLGSF